jgi:Mg2+ and Co2+ transporter CorA
MTNNFTAERVGVLTSLTVILTIPTIVFSLFGINVPVAFGVIAGVTLLVMGGILYVMHRRRWL